MRTVFCLLCSLVFTLSQAPTKFPLYKQCGSSWSEDLMGGASECAACGRQPSTVCEEGCAMTCVSMALAGKDVRIGGEGTNPGNLNAWLRNSSGYICLGGDCNNLQLNAPDHLSSSNVNISFLSENQKPDVPTLQEWIVSDLVCIAHVRNKTHFVLLTGWDTSDPSTFTVNDPGFDQDTYTWDEMADILLYSMQSAGQFVKVPLSVEMWRNPSDIPVAVGNIHRARISEL